MRDPAKDLPIFGLLAEFDRPASLLDAVRAARAAGLERLDAFSPFPVEGLPEALGFRENRIAWLTLAGGIIGAVSGWAIQAYANLDFPINVGNRPLLAWQPFALIVFELMVLFAVGFAIFGMLALNRLPRLHHPLFDVEAFHFATMDKFFLAVFSDDRHFDRDGTRRFLESLEPVRVEEIPQTEPPE